jgi:hypothetical protein
MALTALEIIALKSRYVNDGATNGERANHATPITSGAVGNYFPAVSPANRVAGLTRYRKVFTHVASADDVVASRITTFLSAPTTLTDTQSFLFAATQRGQQSGITGSERKYATGKLNANISAGATAIVANFETGNGANLVIQAGDVCLIFNGTDYDTELEVASVVWTVDQAAITLVAGCTMDFLAADSYVAAAVRVLDVKPTYSNFVENSVSGTFDDTTYPIVLNNVGTDEQSITITKGAANAFSALSDIWGALASGDRTVDYEPNNPLFSVPYFSLPAAGWGGTWLANETIIFQVHPATVQYWHKLTVTAGATQTGTDHAKITSLIDY